MEYNVETVVCDNDEQVQCIKDEGVPLRFRFRISKHRNYPTLECCKDNWENSKTSILIEIMMTLSVSTSGVEKGFSVLENPTRQYTLGDLINIDIDGAEPSDFISEEAIDIWLGAEPGTR